MLFVPCGGKHRLFVQVVGRGHDHGVHIRPGAQGIQVDFYGAAQFPCHGKGVFGVQHRREFCALLPCQNAAQLRAKISRAHQGVSKRFHTEPRF